MYEYADDVLRLKPNDLKQNYAKLNGCQSYFQRLLLLLLMIANDSTED